MVYFGVLQIIPNLCLQLLSFLSKYNKMSTKKVIRPVKSGSKNNKLHPNGERKDGSREMEHDYAMDITLLSKQEWEKSRLHQHQIRRQ